MIFTSAVLQPCLSSSVNWLDHGRTLREQGVEETEMLLLRRKFFYSDQNVDSRDPVQLNLLYVQVDNLITRQDHCFTGLHVSQFPPIKTKVCVILIDFFWKVDQH